LQIVKEVNSNSPKESWIGHFVESIKKELSLFISSCMIYVFRESNSAPRVLAKTATFNHVKSVWLEDISRSITVIVLRIKQHVPRF
jgi:hypothetical protein